MRTSIQITSELLLNQIYINMKTESKQWEVQNTGTSFSVMEGKTVIANFRYSGFGAHDYEKSEEYAKLLANSREFLDVCKMLVYEDDMNYEFHNGQVSKGLKKLAEEAIRKWKA